jgi:hypothetical protein
MVGDFEMDQLMDDNVFDDVMGSEDKTPREADGSFAAA